MGKGHVEELVNEKNGQRAAGCGGGDVCAFGGAREGGGRKVYVLLGCTLVINTPQNSCHEHSSSLQDTMIDASSWTGRA